jgi:hypothetical protein
MTRRLISNDQVLAGMLADPAFRAEWERTALARAVAEAVIRYRAEHQLTQTGLAWLLAGASPSWHGWKRLSTTPPWTPWSPCPAR